MAEFHDSTTVTASSLKATCTPVHLCLRIDRRLQHQQQPAGQHHDLRPRQNHRRPPRLRLVRLVHHPYRSNAGRGSVGLLPSAVRDQLLAGRQSDRRHQLHDHRDRHRVQRSWLRPCIGGRQTYRDKFQGGAAGQVKITPSSDPAVAKSDGDDQEEHARTAQGRRQAESPAGRMSGSTRYSFGWGGSALTAPTASPRITTTTRSRSRPPARRRASATPTAKVRWRTSGYGGSADDTVGWNIDETTLPVTDNGAAGVASRHVGHQQRKVDELPRLRPQHRRHPTDHPQRSGPGTPRRTGVLHLQLPVTMHLVTDPGHYDPAASRTPSATATRPPRQAPARSRCGPASSTLTPPTYPFPATPGPVDFAVALHLRRSRERRQRRVRPRLGRSVRWRRRRRRRNSRSSTPPALTAPSPWSTATAPRWSTQPRTGSGAAQRHSRPGPGCQPMTTPTSTAPS